MNKEVNKYTLAVFLQTIGSGMVMTYMNLFMTDYLLITAAMVSTALLMAGNWLMWRGEGTALMLAALWLLLAQPDKAILVKRRELL